MLTEKENLTQLVEAILFVAGQGVEIKDIAEKLEVDKKQVVKAIEELKEKHQNDGINVITYKESAQMCSNPAYAEDIATVLNPIREKQLTKAALETAAIIAYKQPITKLDIEQVRGVNSDYAVQVLLNFKLIEVVGRKDAIGKPLLYGTTDEFLKRFELQSIEDLPDYEELIERIKVIHADEKSDALYGSTEIIPEEELADSKAKIEAEQQGSNNDQTTDEQLTETVSEETEPAEVVAESEKSHEEDSLPEEQQQVENKVAEVAEVFNNLDNMQIVPQDEVNNELSAEQEQYVKEVLSSANKDDDEIIDNFKDDDML